MKKVRYIRIYADICIDTEYVSEEQKMYKNTNRNNRTEAIRLPVAVIDFLRDMSAARGIDVQTMTEIMAGEWIVAEKKRYRMI